MLLALLPAVVLLRVEGSRAARPNVVLIQTDDQSANTLRAKFRGLDNRIHRAMPNTLDLIARQGTEFTRYYATQPVCGPSRAALLTGRYAHTTGLKRNTGSSGGWTGWQQLPLLNDNLATRLQDAGYRTVHIGKFTNDYTSADGTPETVVPPGWDRWHTMSYSAPTLYYGYYLNRNGVITGPHGSAGYDAVSGEVDPVTCTADRLLLPAAGECQLATDVYTRTAVREIRAAGNRPLYLQLDYNTPHGDARPPVGPQPATRHYDTAFGNRMPRMPSFNEADIRDKPSWLKRVAEPMDRRETERIDTRWRKEMEALRDVDDGVAAIVKTLRRTGKLGNTYLVFLSDNGLFHGEHRLSSAKFLAYEPSARVPMMIRGPGVPAGRRSAELVGNVDIAPTVLDLARAGGRNRLDGRSLRPFWKDPKRRTRRPLLIESWIGTGNPARELKDAGLGPELESSGAAASVAAPALNFRAVRAGRYKYIRYSSGDRELYDLARDPGELQNRISAPRYRPVRRWLESVLRQRQDCRAARCRKVTGPLPARKAVR